MKHRRKLEQLKEALKKITPLNQGATVIADLNQFIVVESLLELGDRVLRLEEAESLERMERELKKPRPVTSDAFSATYMYRIDNTKEKTFLNYIERDKETDFPSNVVWYSRDVGARMYVRFEDAVEAYQTLTGFRICKKEDLRIVSVPYDD